MIFIKKQKEISNHQDYLLSERKPEREKPEPETFLEYIEDQIDKAKQEGRLNEFSDLLS